MVYSLQLEDGFYAMPKRNGGLRPILDFRQVDAYVHQMVLWSRDRLRPQLTGWYSRRHWGSIAKGHGPIPSQLFVKVSLP
ncbi:UNVERIFIED_CONTAM: hypothetical protein FKN15_043807 [Acipenser sinensis]